MRRKFCSPVHDVACSVILHPVIVLSSAVSVLLDGLLARVASMSYSELFPAWRLLATKDGKKGYAMDRDVKFCKYHALLKK